MKHLVTADARYFVIRGRLWRCTNPYLAENERERLVKVLMDARRQIALIKREGVGDLRNARKLVDETKIALGERGPVWWEDGAPDYNQHLVENTPYAGSLMSKDNHQG